MDFKPYSQDNMAACLELFDLNCPRFLREKAIRLFVFLTAAARFKVHAQCLFAWLARATADRLFWSCAGVVRNLCAHLDHGSSRIPAPKVRRGNDGAAFHASSGSGLSESGCLY